MLLYDPVEGVLALRCVAVAPEAVHHHPRWCEARGAQGARGLRGRQQGGFTSSQGDPCPSSFDAPLASALAGALSVTAAHVFHAAEWLARVVSQINPDQHDDGVWGRRRGGPWWSTTRCPIGTVGARRRQERLRKPQGDVGAARVRGGRGPPSGDGGICTSMRIGGRRSALGQWGGLHHIHLDAGYIPARTRSRTMTGWISVHVWRASSTVQTAEHTEPIRLDSHCVDVGYREFFDLREILPYLTKMDLAASPLDTQELVDHCIGFLHDSVPDLAACALSHLFNNIRLTHTVCRATTEKRCRRFLELVGESPHLIRLSSRLEVETSLISQHSLWNLANVPFTHLRELHVYHNFGHLSHEVFPGIQKLFSLSTLQAVALQCNMDCEEGAPGIFKGLWNGCSPSVKHLGLSCTPVKSIVKAPPIQPSTASSRIELESLHITYAGDISDWLQDSQCPFDFSHLKTLCIYTDTTVPCYNPFVTILGNIQCLDFAACLDCPTFDLGKFTQLSVLRLSIPRSADLPMALETLYDPTTRSDSADRTLLDFPLGG
ncbi:hypothetical protein B0H10DRAFT_1967819 [Mycena sp. CBHHK59/15]|nr:hypothetical protein B0H10DRAFT_1967819 [Mycena sp. CBHHK59/15]